MVSPAAWSGGGGGALSHSAATAPIITLFIPGTPLQTTPLTEACMIHSKPHRVQNAGPWAPWQVSDLKKKESLVHRWGGGDSAPSQIRGGKFRCRKFRGAPWILCGIPRQSPQCVLLVCERFMENPEFRGQFETRNFPRENKVPRNPPPCTSRGCRVQSSGPWDPVENS